MMLPDRISSLIARVEAGQPLTQADVDRVALLQALDTVKLGEDFAREAMANDTQLTEDLGKTLGETCQALKTAD